MSVGLIALDWGTTNVRAALLSADGTVREERCGESGVGHFSTAQFQARFQELTDGWPKAPALAAGMVGSRQGWLEAPYLACPTGVDGLAEQLASMEQDGRTISIVPGLKMHDENHHDVMRGEETQIAGLLAQKPDFSGTLVLPGTHSKWVHVHKGMVKKFTTYMTGEMFDALSTHTILRHSVDDTGDADGDRDTFASAIADIIAGGGSPMARLFDLRAMTLLEGLPGRAGRERLSGLLIGMEFQSAAQDGYDVQAFTCIGSPGLIERYSRAAAVLAADVETVEGTTLVWPALFNLAQRAGLMGGAK